jgi:dTDP-4-dehydrorhamnose 3,5-epimerase
MRFTPTALPGVWLIEPERIEDERGFFARVFCEREFAAHGLETRWVQCSVSFNRRQGTLRGMHWQAAPHEEVKLVRCTRGAIFDVALDLRPGSATFRRWTAAELTAANGRALYIPCGVAHGLQTLADDTEVCYQISEFYHADLQRGARWDDPAFGIVWPPGERILSERDARHPLLPEPKR